MALQRVIPPLPATERGTFCSISCDKAGERLLYCSGTNVIWRPVANSETPEEVFCWKGHVKKTTCAAMSPNGQWVASGDVTGGLRLWGAKGEHAQKNEYRLWDGTVKDVAWSDDSGRPLAIPMARGLVAAGDGKEVRAAAMIWDTGSKTGEVGGHTKQVNSISFRSQRPFRVVTGGEDLASWAGFGPADVLGPDGSPQVELWVLFAAKDMQVNFHQGPPFKFARSHSAHTNFVNCVRFSPDGNWFVSAGSDSKLCLYEGKDGEFQKEFEKPANVSGSFWVCAWSPDSGRVATAGGDKKLRLWDREKGAQVAEAAAGTALADMQVGLVWASAARLVSVCLDGRLLSWDVTADGLNLAGVMDGTQGPLNCGAAGSVAMM
ncbi:unnamed protein product [Effrenium voratum]|nr:unnamed protein product [Effrenium voratum]